MAIKQKIEKYESGLKHIHLQVPFANAVTQAFIVNAGSCDEQSPEYYGIAHFIEHMVFNGSEEYPDNKELSSIKENLGIHENAWTWNSNTVYYISSPKKSFQSAFDILYNRVFYPLFRDTDIEKEKGIVLEELRMIKDEPDFEANVAMQKYMYTGTGFGHETIGEEQSIKKFNKSLLMKFFAQNYQPDNITFVTYSSHSSEEIFDLVKKDLSLLKKTTQIEKRKKHSSIKFKPKSFNFKGKNEMAIYSLESPFLAPKSIEEYVFYLVLEALLQHGKLSLLSKKLVYEHALIDDYQFYIVDFRDFISLAFRADILQKNKKKIMNLVKDICLNIRINNDEFERAKAFACSIMIRKMESSEIITDSFMYNIFLNKNFQEYDLRDILKIIMKAERSDFIQFFSAQKINFCEAVIEKL